MSETTWSASLKAESLLVAEVGALVRDMPGMSKVVTVKVLRRRVQRCEKEPQSPSPEGIRRRSGPEPERSTYQEIPSFVCTLDEVAIFMLNLWMGSVDEM